VLARLCERRGDLAESIVLERDAVALVRAGAAPLDGVRSIHHLGRLLVETGERNEGEALLREAAAIIASRLDDLRDEDLRRGYREQPEAKRILADGGLSAAE
jgi:eukaryotic-like serine/threonine-protein kinase